VSTDPIEEGFAALRHGNTAAARRAFESALVEAETGEALEGLGEALYLDRDYSASAARYEHAYSAYRARGDAMAAGRAARMVAWILGNVLGGWAVQSGWLARARTVLEEADEDRPERGWVLIITAYTEPDARVREALLREAVTIGRRFADPDIEFEALSYLAGLLVMIDRVEEGLVLFDEAMTAACAGELRELGTVDSMFCGFFWLCELLNDVPRADQWMRAGMHILNRRNVVAAFCRAHYGGILTAAGRWSEAETELTAAAEHFARGMPERRAAAIIRLADLRVRQGRLEEADQLLKGLHQHPDAVRTLASLHLARGDTPLAKDLLERVTGGPDDEVPTVGESTMVGPLLALLVDVYLEEDDLVGAQSVAARLDALARAQRGPYLKAAAALAKGRICIAGQQEDARFCLHEAIAEFARAQLPMELARARLELARALSERSPQVAIAEAKAALDEFERLEAARLADAAAALLRSLGAPSRSGPKGAGALTKREAEVLELIGAGLSNPEIADRLYISRKTVEHHVGNVLSKLRLRNRAEAAAHAMRQRTSL
jgi:DNA-binding CsgD family transcriptional regulator